MKPGEIHRLLSEIEGKFPVDRWKLYGMHIWPILRIRLSISLTVHRSIRDAFNMGGYSSLAFIHKVIGTIRDLACYLTAYLKDRANNDRFTPAREAVFLSYTTSRFFAVEGRMYDVFVGPLEEILLARGLKGISFEYSPKGEYRIPRHNKSVFLNPRLTLASLRSFFKADEKLDKPAELEMRGLLKSLGIDGSEATALLGRVTSNAKYIRATAEYFKSVFKRISPRIGFVVNYYSDFGMAFDLACREYGIPSVDIQHGFQGELHPAYGCWANLPEGGYEVLPSLFWTWTEEDSEVIRKWSLESGGFHKPIWGGNLCLEMFKDEDNLVSKRFEEKILSIKSANKEKSHILVSLQPSEGLIPIYKEAIMRSPESWVWWLRLHPGMMDEKEKMISEIYSLPPDRVNIDDASQLPLYLLLKHMDVHVTQASSVVREAEEFGLPSVIVDPVGSELFGRQLHEGLAVEAFTPEALLTAVRDHIEKKKNGISFARGAKMAKREGSLNALLSLIGAK